MSNNTPRDLSAFSLLELFCIEADSQIKILTDGLLALDRNGQDAKALEPLMRAAHSIKGAAAVVNLEPVVQLAHEMENCIVAVQAGRLLLTPDCVDTLLAGVDIISRVTRLDTDAVTHWFEQQRAEIAAVIAGIAAISVSAMPVADDRAAPPAPEAMAVVAPTETADLRQTQAMKVSVENFDRLLSLASESLVAVHMLHPVLQSMRRFKKMQDMLLAAVDDLHQSIAAAGSPDRIHDKSLQVWERITPLKPLLVQHLSELEACERRLLAASQTTLDDVVALRMRPFSDGVQAFPRMVRDLARSLGKEVRLEILGQHTQVDREILSALESPINHLLRNALDHGIEPPRQRLAAGKAPEGVIRLDARHRAGMLVIHVSDDGRGIDPARIRRCIVGRNMATEAMAAAMSEAELLEFLLLPGFSLKDVVSELSGRGVGLDILHEAVRQHYGKVRLESVPGKGFHAYITLPVTQSVVRALIIDIGGEAYAIPIPLIERVLRIDRASIHLLEDKPFFTLDGEHVGLVSAAQLLELSGERSDAAELSAVLIGSGARRYALTVNAVLGEKNLVVQPIDTMLGKLRDVAAAALLDDGSPVLILDVADLLQSIEKLLDEGKLCRLEAADPAGAHRVKRVLVVDDSLTVREMERQLLLARGFAVDVAVDGVDGWNAVRSQSYDLVITDIDMPRMDGIELVTLIKKDLRLHKLPVMIVSYKDRPEDRARGISAGADYYLTKGSFHDQTLLEAVTDLIGESVA